MVQPRLAELVQHGRNASPAEVGEAVPRHVLLLRKPFGADVAFEGLLASVRSHVLHDVRGVQGFVRASRAVAAEIVPTTVWVHAHESTTPDAGIACSRGPRSDRLWARFQKNERTGSEERWYRDSNMAKDNEM